MACRFLLVFVLPCSLQEGPIEEGASIGPFVKASEREDVEYYLFTLGFRMAGVTPGQRVGQVLCCFSGRSTS